jgi:membrane dipeptidase
MNRLGMMIDLSHAGEITFWDVIELSKAPVIASHSSCRALCDVTRNLNDEQLKALGKNGGCVQITPVSMFISLSAGKREAMREALDKIGILVAGYMEVLKIYSEEPALYDRIQAAYLEEVEEINLRFPEPDVTDFVDHIDHAVKLIGIDHVGIGSDFDGGGGVEGFRNPAEAVNVTAELLRRGYSEQEIARLWGGNLMRLWREVDQKASALQAETANL